MTKRTYSVDEQAHLLLFDRRVMLFGHVAYFFVLAILYVFYLPIVPERPMMIWLTLASVIFSYIIIFDIALFVRDPAPEELLRVWRAFDKKHTMLFDLIAVGVVAFLLPFGDDAHRIVTVSFCVGYVPLQMISDPENVFGNRFSVVAVLGSYIVYLLSLGALYATILSVFMLIYGATLFYSSDALRRVVVDAVRHRRSAEAATAKLSVALDAVAAERDAKTRFIASASHDLGQPLQAARLFSEQWGSAPNAALATRAQSGLTRALTSAQHMLSHMLHHMRLEADAVEPQVHVVPIGDVMDRMAAQYAAMAEQSGVKISAIGSTMTIATDAVLLERAIGNLIQNALVHSGADRIVIGARSKGRDMQFWVIDNGVGILPDDAARIFDDYAQGSNSRAAIKGGFGLGLASVRRLAGLLGGSVALSPHWQKGAAFCIALPKRELAA